MSNWLSYLFAVGVVLGGVDRLLGNRFGLGARFEEAFHLLGPYRGYGHIMTRTMRVSGWYIQNDILRRKSHE